MDDRRPPPPRRIDGRLAVAAVVVLLALVVVAVAVRGPAWTAPSQSAPRQTTGQVVTSTPPTPTRENPTTANEQSVLPPSQASGRLMLLILLVLVFALTTLLSTGLARAYRARRGAPLAAPAAVPHVEHVLAQAADRALLEVEQPDAREAVVRSWLLLGAAAADAGAPARPAETATEYAQRIAAGFTVPTTDLHRLAELYREARFSDHPVGEVQRAEARELLRRLRSGLPGGTR